MKSAVTGEVTLLHRFLLTGDIHVREAVPRFRSDDYTAEMLKKLGFIQSEALQRFCNAVLYPGDITDSPRLTPRMFYLIINLLKRNPDFISNFGVFGQHDLRYHTNPWESALAVLEAAGCLKLLRSEMGPIHMPPRPDDPTEIYLYGCGWNEKIPEIKHRDDNIRNILLIHRLFSTVKLFPSDDISVHGGDFLKNTGWDLVVAGDNHIHFTFEHKGRYLVNCGSMMRSKIDQMSHKPVVYEYLARDRKLTCTEIPCNEIELVMDVDRIEEFKERDEELEVFVQKIKDKTEIEGLDFELNMDERMQAPDITPEMKELWKEVVHDASARLK